MRRLLALCLAGFALAGCGSESGDESPGTPADTPPATTEQREDDYPY